jgi:hypothetical protein
MELTMSNCVKYFLALIGRLGFDKSGNTKPEPSETSRCKQGAFCVFLFRLKVFSSALI